MRHGFYWLMIMLLSACSTDQPSADAPVGVLADSGMVVTAHPLASQVGIAILRQGGNAFDAAVAVQFALAVCYPRAGNISGGGFALCYTSEGEGHALDFREVAPAAAHRDMFLDAKGEPRKEASTLGCLAVGVPATVDGMVRLHQRLGSLPWASLVEPAIALARQGVVLTEFEVTKLNENRADIRRANLHVPFLCKPDDAPWVVGDTIVYEDLAKTLEAIRDRGRAGFYEGEVAMRLLAEIQRGKGILRQEDLDSYEARWREPLRGDFRGCQVLTMPPSSSGGIALLQLLKASEALDWKALGHNSADAAHYMTEFERRVYADRAEHLGDADFYPVPTDMLLDSAYIARRMQDINPERKTDSQQIKPGKVKHITGKFETTHFSITDRHGNAVAVTTTLNGNYGCKVVVEGGGFFLNNEMDDFSIKPGHPNQFGLVGAEANAIAPGKRMLSSMTPTILVRDRKPLLVLGTPGGSTIITSVYQVILNAVAHDMGIQAAVNARRFHSQWLPDTIFYEDRAFEHAVMKQLSHRGHALKRNPSASLGKVEAIWRHPDGRWEGAADHTRGDDTALGY